MSPLSGEQQSDALPDRPGSAEDEGPRLLERQMPAGGTDGRRGGGVSAVGVEQHGDAQAIGGDHGLDRLGEEAFAGRDIAAADEQGGAFEVARMAREDGTVDQPGDLLGLDAAIAEQLVGAGVNGDHAIKDAGVRIAVELDEDSALFHDWGVPQRCSMGRMGQMGRISQHPSHLSHPSHQPIRHFGENGCFTLSFWDRISSMRGSPFMARAMASLVAS
jgi:hypothetical protein